MNKENENAIFDAADVICLNCIETIVVCTLYWKMKMVNFII